MYPPCALPRCCFIGCFPVCCIFQLFTLHELTYITTPADNDLIFGNYGSSTSYAYENEQPDAPNKLVVGASYQASTATTLPLIASLWKAKCDVDVDGDGYKDLIAQVYTSSGGAAGTRIYWCKNNIATMGFVNGFMSSCIYIDEGNHNWDWDVAQMNPNQDQAVDFIVTKYSNMNGVYVYFNNGPGTDFERVTITTSPSRGVTVFDSSNNGLMDIFAVESTNLRLFKNLGGKSFASGVTIAATHSYSNINSLVHGDFDGDGNIDIFMPGRATSYHEIFWLKKGAEGYSELDSVTAAPVSGNLWLGRAHVADVNSDGFPDIIVGGYNFPDVYALSSGSTRGFEAAVSLPSYNTYDISVGDVDSDGDYDILLGAYSTGVFPILYNTLDIPAPDLDGFNPYYRESNNAKCADHVFGFGCECTFNLNGVVTNNPVELDPVESSVSGDTLKVVFTEPIQYQYKGSRPGFTLTDKDGVAGDADCMALFSWTAPVEPTKTDPSDCTPRVWTGTASLVSVSSLCPFQVVSDTDAETRVRLHVTVTNYEEVPLVEGDGDDETGTVTTTYVQREVTHYVKLDIKFNNQISVSVGNIEAFSEVVTARALVSQAVVRAGAYPESDVSTVTLSLYLSTQHPFRIVYGSGAKSSPTTLSMANPTEESVDCVDQDNVDCVSVFNIVVTASNPDTVCNFDGEYSIIFNVKCNDAWEASGDCPVDGSGTVTVTFNLDTPNHCPVVKAAEDLDASLTSYLSDADYTESANEKDEFLDGDRMYFRGAVRSERVSLTSAILYSVSVSGGTIGSKSLFLLPDGSTTDGDTVAINAPTPDVTADTDPTDTTDFKYVPFSFLADDTFLGLSTRSTEQFTVTAVLDVTYKTVFSQAGADDTIQTQTRREEVSFPLVRGQSVSDESAATAQISIGRRESDSSSSSVNLSSASNVTLGAVALVALVALVTMGVAIRRLFSPRKVEGTPTTPAESSV